MAELLTNTTDLTKVAAAIREKGGTSDQLVYPDGFVTAIQAIQAIQTGINGVKIGTYTVTDGILSFSVAQEDFEADDRYTNFYVKKSSAKWGCFANKTGSADVTSWIATTETSAAFEYNTTCISVERSGVFYNINWTLGDSLSDYYSGEVTVYALPSS
jgi:hypothetical protein